MPRMRTFQLMRVRGIRVGVDFTWFLVLFFFVTQLSGSFGAQLGPGQDTLAYVLAVAASLAFFASILLHELGHAVAARREGVEVIGIDLWALGGSTQMRSGLDTPGSEFRVSVAGPVATLLVVVACTAGGLLLEGGSFFQAFTTFGEAGGSVTQLLLGFLASINLYVLGFNLIPAFPLDGGRIARAAVWRLTGDRLRATRVSAALGQGFSWLLIAFGLYLAFAVGDTFSGIIFAVIGWIIGQGARAELAVTAVTAKLDGVTAADVMETDPVVVPADTPAPDALDAWFLRYDEQALFVVASDGTIAGHLRRAAVQEAVDSGSADATAGSLSEAVASDALVREDMPLQDLLGSEPLRRLGTLVAIDARGALRGLVTVDRVSREMRTRLTPS